VTKEESSVRTIRENWLDEPETTQKNARQQTTSKRSAIEAPAVFAKGLDVKRCLLGFEILLTRPSVSAVTSTADYK
jgi:hypothetical protein